MAYLNGPELSAFRNLVHGVHDFNDEEMERIRKVADIAKEVVESANKRQEREMMGRCQPRQLGVWH